MINQFKVYIKFKNFKKCAFTKKFNLKAGKIKFFDFLKQINFISSLIYFQNNKV